MLAHGAVLRKNGFTAQQVIAILEDYHTGDLSPQEMRVMDYASKISVDPGSITAEDAAALRQDGMSDEQIMDVALAAAARNFFSRLVEAMGVEPDPELIQREPELWEYLKELKKK